MTRIVMDTNVIVSAIGWNGPPSRLLEACLKGRLRLFISPASLQEVAEVLARPKLAVVARHPDLPPVLAWLHHPARLVFPAAEPRVVEEDPDDNKVVACAVEAKAEAVITGDDHLLRLGTCEGIAIITPDQACARWGV
ncbi:MAG: putative toxin-antitoxin system toxin component, PIN family [Thermoanaerobacterales bacterium]|nr:putative toxin-antitoxin system toxin component, PIN family [Thermoanaerobacterales bacterium]